MSAKKKVAHPFAKKEPKPTRARLVGLLDPLGRRRYAEVERFLAGIAGATSGLHYYSSQGGETWGWAVRYILGDKQPLCTLHLLPDTFEATIIANKEMQGVVKAIPMSSETRRRIGRARFSGGALWIRLPLRNDADIQVFQALINAKAACRAAGKAAKAKKQAEGAEAKKKKTA